MTQKGQKPSHQDSHCVQKPSLQNKTGSQKLHDIKLGSFTDGIYKLSDISSFLSQQIKLFFNEDTDHCNKHYIICWLLDSTYGHTKIYMIHINVR